LLTACGSSSPTQPSVSARTPSTTSAPVSEARTYLVTFTADSACTSLPANVQTRTYSGSSDGGPYKLAGAVFASYGDVISLVIRGDSAEAWFQGGPIMEWVTPESTLMIEGHAQGPISGPKIELPVSATYLFCPIAEADGRCSVPFIRCESTKHRLTLTPQ
jgi:hypothetical protein